jgi:hypothetical protein
VRVVRVFLSVAAAVTALSGICLISCSIIPTQPTVTERLFQIALVSSDRGVTEIIAIGNHAANGKRLTNSAVSKFPSCGEFQG